MKIYTKMGNHGQTMLGDGSMTKKTDPRIDAYGTVDELNCFVGLLAEELRHKAEQSPLTLPFSVRLQKLQNSLFNLGAELATPAESPLFSRISLVSEQHIRELESEIDAWQAALPELKNFILPGGSRLNAIAHVCRTVCRRAEREALTAHLCHPIRSVALVFLNRLSDWFFVLSRTLSKLEGTTEILWKSGV